MGDFVVELTIVSRRETCIIPCPIQMQIVLEFTIFTVSNGEKGSPDRVQTMQLMENFKLNDIMVWLCGYLDGSVRKTSCFGCRDRGEAVCTSHEHTASIGSKNCFRKHES